MQVYMKSEYNNIIKKTINTIKKEGISKYIKKLKIPIPDEDIKNKKDLIKYIDKILGLYHDNSFSMIASNSKSKSISLKKHQKLPKLTYSNGVGTIKYYHFYGLNKKIENDITKLVNLTYNKWMKLGLKKIVIDLTEHYGGNMWPGVRSLYPIMGDVTLFAWGDKKVSRNMKK